MKYLNLSSEKVNLIPCNEERGGGIRGAKWGGGGDRRGVGGGGRGKLFNYLISRYYLGPLMT